MANNKSCVEVTRRNDMLRLCGECVRQDIYDPLSQWLWPWEVWRVTHRKMIYTKGRKCNNKNVLEMNKIY